MGINDILWEPWIQFIPKPFVLKQFKNMCENGNGN